MGTGLSVVGQIVRRHDPDRFLASLFAPAARREALWTLYAFNHELARAREVVREPFAALIRLQWWREVVEGAQRAHEVAGPLRLALDAGWLDAADLEGMIAGREMEAEPIETSAAFQSYALAAAGGVMVAAGRALGMNDAEALRPWGAGTGIAGVLRSIPAHARQGRCLLPEDLLATVKLSPAKVIAEPGAPALQWVTTRLQREAQALLARPIPVPRNAVAAALPAVLARRDLGSKGRGRRLALVLAGLIG